MYVDMGCMPMKPKFYFCSSFCCCCASLPVCLQKAQSTTFWCWVLALGKQMCCLEKHFWGFGSSSGKVPHIRRCFSPFKCHVVWWTLTVSHCQEVTAVSAGRMLWAWVMNSVLGMWGKQQWVQNFRLKSPVNAVSWELAPELEHHKMQFHKSVSGF